MQKHSICLKQSYDISKFLLKVNHSKQFIDMILMQQTKCLCKTQSSSETHNHLLPTKLRVK